MFESLFKEYEIDIAKADHMFETAMDIFNTNLIEKHMLVQEGYIDSQEDIYDLYHESVGSIKDKIKEFFTKIKEAFKKLVLSVKNTVKAQLVKRDANKKLKEVKKQLVENKKLAAQAKGKKVSCFDSVKYTRAYTKFINTTISDYAKVCSKKYNDVKEYKNAYADFLTRMYKNEEKLHLNDEQAWKTGLTVLELVDKANFEVNNYEDTMKKLNDFCISSMEKLHDMAMKEDDTSKISDIESASTKISSKFSSTLKKIGKSPVVLIGLAIAEIGILTKLSSKAFDVGDKHGEKKGYDKGYREGMDKGFKAGYNMPSSNMNKASFARGYNDGVARRNGPAISGPVNRNLVR